MADNAYKISGQICKCTPVFCPKSEYLFCSCSSVIRAYSITTGENVLVLEGHTDEITCLKINPANPLQLLSSSIDGTIRIWDYKEQCQCLKTLRVGSPVLFMELFQVVSEDHHSSSASVPHCFLVVEIKGKGGAGGSNPKKKKKKKKRKKAGDDGDGGSGPETEGAAAATAGGGDVLPQSEAEPFALVEYSLGARKIVRTLTREKRRPVGLAGAAGALALCTPRCLTVVAAAAAGEGGLGGGGGGGGGPSALPRRARRRAEAGREYTCVAAAAAAPGDGGGGLVVATGHRGGRIQLWRGLAAAAAAAAAAGGGAQQAPPPPVVQHWHAHDVAAVAFGPDGAGALLSGGEEAVLVLWQLGTGKQDFLPRLGAPLTALAAAPGFYAVAAADNTVRLVRAAGLETRWQVGGLCLAPGGGGVDAAHAAAAGAAGPVRLFPAPGAPGPVALNGKAGHLQFYSPAADRPAGALEVEPFARVSRVQGDRRHRPPQVALAAFAAGGGGALATLARRPAAAAAPGPQETLQFWVRSASAEEGGYAPVTAVEAPHAEPVTALAMAGTGRLAATAAADGTVAVWRRRAAAAPPPPPPPGSKLPPAIPVERWIGMSEIQYRKSPVHALAISPDASVLAVAQTGVVSLWSPGGAAAGPPALLGTALPPLPPPAAVGGGGGGVGAAAGAVAGLAFCGAGGALRLAGWAAGAAWVWDPATLDVAWCYTAKAVAAVATGSLDLPGGREANLVLSYQTKSAGQWCLLAFDPADPVPLHHWRLPAGAKPASLALLAAAPPPPHAAAAADGDNDTDGDRGGEGAAASEGGVLALTDDQEVFFLPVPAASPTWEPTPAAAAGKKGKEKKKKKGPAAAAAAPLRKKRVGRGGAVGLAARPAGAGEAVPALLATAGDGEEGAPPGEAEEEEEAAAAGWAAAGGGGGAAAAEGALARALPASSLELPGLGALFDAVMGAQRRAAAAPGAAGRIMDDETSDFDDDDSGEEEKETPDDRAVAKTARIPSLPMPKPGIQEDFLESFRALIQSSA